MQAPPDLIEEIERLRREAEQRHDLIALAAHELRNPLHALSLHLTLVRSMADAKCAHEVSERISRAQVALSRYAERVTVLMELLGSPELLYPVHPQETDVVQRIESLVENLEHEARSRGIALKVEPAGPCVAWCDGLALEQIIDNLLLNAFKHSGAREIIVSIRADAQNAVISVRDDGIGIAQEDQRRIFEKAGVGPAARRGPGSGLGLWIVSRLLAAMGGSIQLLSRASEGATFAVTIPLQPPQSSS